MNKRAFYRSLKSLKKELQGERFNSLLGICADLSATAKAVQSISYQTFGETQNGQIQRNQITNIVTQAIAKEKSKVTYRKLIVNCYEIEDSIREFLNQIDANQTIYVILNKFLVNLEAFLDVYENYRTNFQPEMLYRLSFASENLASNVENLVFSIDLLLSNAESKADSGELTQLELYLSNVSTLKAFGLKLEAIDAIYLEICHLFDVSITDNPIVIEHIENGSLWVKVAGHALTATVLTTILNSASAYYLESFTETGQLKQLPSSVTAVNDLLKISEQLEKNGYNTTEINDQLNSATKKIARQLDLLLGDQPTIEINDQVHDVGDLFKDKLLEHSRTKLLTNKEEHS